MTRRPIGLLVTLGLIICVAPPMAEAQLPPKVPRVGLPSPFSPADTAR
jgi:hypothetical protein